MSTITIKIRYSIYRVNNGKNRKFINKKSYFINSRQANFKTKEEAIQVRLVF